ncbi:acyltransferase family protein [Cronobacter turicensis]
MKELRKDIQGLRALAIIGVIIFHFNKEILPGGFAGVDVFFVISGFLMTKIILTGLDNNNFNIAKFYYARVKRIVPALSAVCLLCVAFGWTVLLPKDYLELAHNAIGSMLFYSNYLYASQTGYFDTASVDNILLHTWSLSVEWQFYLIYPLILFVLSLFLNRTLIRSLIIIGLLASLAISINLTMNSPTKAYFTLNARAWEMLAGGLAVIFNEKEFLKKKSRIWEGVGLILIATGYYLFDERTAWPGYNAIVPVLGTFLVICATRNSSSITGSWPLQFIGKISYSLYLVHWPLIVFSRKVGVDLDALAYFTLSLLIASVIYYSIERTKKLSFLNMFIAITALTFSNYVQNTHGASFRVPEELKMSSEEFQKKYYGGYGYKTNTPYSSHAKDGVDFIIFGDSFAAQYAKAIDEKGLHSINIFFHGCPIMPDYSRYKDGKEDLNCSKAYAHLLNTFKNNKNADVLFASAWDNYKDLLIKRNGKLPEDLSFNEFADVWINQIQKIMDAGGKRHYYIIGRPVPTNSNSYGCLVQNVLPGYKLFKTCNSKRSLTEIEINNKLREAFKANGNVTFIDPNKVLCDKDGCSVTVGKEPLYTDGAHLSIYGARMVFDEVTRVISEIRH